jgi:ABC-type polysaccharide transport system permease subunit
MFITLRTRAYHCHLSLSIARWISPHLHILFQQDLFLIMLLSTSRSLYLSLISNINLILITAYILDKFSACTLNEFHKIEVLRRHFNILTDIVIPQSTNTVLFLPGNSSGTFHEIVALWNFHCLNFYISRKETFMRWSCVNSQILN